MVMDSIGHILPKLSALKFEEVLEILALDVLSLIKKYKGFNFF